MHQLVGAAKMVHLVDSSSKGGQLVDGRALSPTRTAILTILAMLERPQYRDGIQHGPILIITTEHLEEKWVNALEGSVNKKAPLKIFVPMEDVGIPTLYRSHN